MPRSSKRSLPDVCTKTQYIPLLPCVLHAPQIILLKRGQSRSLSSTLFLNTLHLRSSPNVGD